METYDVIIVGGGPAGLKCAETLGRSDKSVLLLEKDAVFGDKLCAGGLTRRAMSLLEMPDPIIEQRICDAALFSPRNRSLTKTSSPLLFTLDRRELGKWQRGRLEGSGVKILTNARVIRIDPEGVTLKDGISYGYHYIVGADGYASVIRRYLGLPVRKKLIGLQVTLPARRVTPVLEIYLNSRLFKSWYAWVFPHRNSIAVGCCCDPRFMKTSELKDNFHLWLRMKGMDTAGATLSSCPISYDYRGIRFGNIFLVGEAAGLASGLSGEGIYQALVSGQAAARMIMDPDYVSEGLKRMVRFNAIQNRFMRMLYAAGIFRGFMIELMLLLMKNDRIRQRVSSAFS
jgi:geranylgeranyl reductase family protein